MKSSEQWITENFESLVTQYGGKYIGVVGEEVIAVALTPPGSSVTFVEER